MTNKVIVGSRKSKLAMAQTKLVIASLEKLFPEIEFEIKNVITEGDRNRHASLAKIGGKGVFVKEIEDELKNGTIDFAVHSLKDVMPVLPEELVLGAFPKRVSPYDCLVSRKNLSSMNDLPKGARIGTNSLRRQGQLLSIRPDLKIIPIRGNIDTRLRKIDTEALDGIILAEAGLTRLNIDLSSYHILNLQNYVMPAVGQGCLAIECRKNDTRIRQMLDRINDEESAYCVQIEREFMRELGGSCNFPIGGHAYAKNGQILFDGLIASPNGEHVIKETKIPANNSGVGKKVADQLLAKDKFGIIEGE
ncbi:hydroxymethylbilane synthase [Limosilactobacillus reuteri]|uniref:Porphobilinogen deaminase n=1 Tax=Limosilactobacillus reuteri TaxID=1598 RepID=A0A256VA29_LIMRT|nr:hydroxymethylbilane synthase [Limosilactobacillus reuteri]OYS61198.1 hydroxymethylbilane synthase [Limosilactobacillus reuteri]OYS62602.1 hydroxymethylbilane synthase [Limosilactobacillus reuteri]OYS66215.1 hydroxymethylbilane synthase [Limosilactobacillus reuteri]OYS73957.1 hydroxymethylbilane synthase [Limosilactobacillus reuteri]OYS76678.1 hydroxymethylbilane synthase [Limosilactobacillus reuteri]